MFWLVKETREVQYSNGNKKKTLQMSRRRQHARQLLFSEAPTSSAPLRHGCLLSTAIRYDLEFLRYEHVQHGKGHASPRIVVRGMKLDLPTLLFISKDKTVGWLQWNNGSRLFLLARMQDAILYL